MKEVYDYLKRVGDYYLATVDAEGKPRVRPFGTVDLFEGKLYFQTGASKDVSKQMKANPNIEICAFDKESGSWIRLAGKAYVDDNRAARVHMLEEYPMLKTMYSPDDGNTEVFYITDATAVIASFTEEPKTIKF